MGVGFLLLVAPSSYVHLVRNKTMQDKPDPSSLRFGKIMEDPVNSDPRKCFYHASESDPVNFDHLGRTKIGRTETMQKRSWASAYALISPKHRVCAGCAQAHWNRGIGNRANDLLWESVGEVRDPDCPCHEDCMIAFRKQRPASARIPEDTFSTSIPKVLAAVGGILIITLVAMNLLVMLMRY